MLDTCTTNDKFIGIIQFREGFCFPISFINFDSILDFISKNFTAKNSIEVREVFNLQTQKKEDIYFEYKSDIITINHKPDDELFLKIYTIKTDSNNQTKLELKHV